ncbi:uncharacterized protein [Amphiura filiformis]|uniref:uncharacterized protein n=1 Tax=Amphiura filiformis TaxID=82378 RepID=UPI003B220154
MESVKPKKSAKKTDDSTRSRGTVVLPYVKGVTERVSRVMKKYNVSTAMKPHNTLRRELVHLKDKRDPNNLTQAVYKIPCLNCDLSYIGETGRKFGTRLDEHRKEVEKVNSTVTTRAGRKESLTTVNKSAITDHVVDKNHVIGWGDAEIIDDAYLGCFYDFYVRVLPLGEIRTPDMTIGRCINYCVDFRNDIRYAGVEDGNQCFCGTANARYEVDKRSDLECSQPCVGNENQTCGNVFRIAVYDISLLQCPLPEMHRYLNADENVQVKKNVTFACQPDFTIMGTPSVQCIFDDNLMDTKWETELPVCTFPSSVNESSPNTTPESKIIPPHESDTTVIIAGTTGGAVLFVVCVIVVVVVWFRRKKQRTGPGENATPVPSGQTQYNNKSDTPFYATVNGEGPVYTSVNKDSYNTPSTHATNGEILNPGNDTIPPIQSPKRQKPVQPYSYTDVTIDSSNVPDIKITDRQNDTDDIDESGWAENDLYSRTGDNEEEQEGWNDNSLYATTSQC